VPVGSEHSSLRAAVIAVGERWSTGQRDLVGIVAELDASGEWALDGAATCSHWVAAALDVEVSTAREWVRVGRALRELPIVSAAFEQGRLSYSKVRALTRVVTKEREAELCALAERVAAGRLGHALASWLARHEAPAETAARQHRARALVWHVDPDGMVFGWFRLPPADAAVLTAGVDAVVMQRRPDASADACGGIEARWPSVAQQRADALVELVRGGGAEVVTEVVLHVRGDGCTLDDGTPIADSFVERIAPQSFVRALLHDARGRPIDASGRHRHPSARQRRVVRERDGTCVDCGATEFLEYDHEPDYELSGRTVVAELRLRCRECHRARHRRQQRPA
jgi:5-methylcytosine-specific restriction endonuclease McrA